MSYTRHDGVCSLVTEPSLPCDRGIIIDTQYPPGISGQRRKLCLWKKMLRKSLPSFLDVMSRCSLLIVRVLFHGFIIRLHCGAAMRSQCLRSRRDATHNQAGLCHTLTAELRHAVRSVPCGGNAPSFILKSAVCFHIFETVPAARRGICGPCPP